MCSYCERDDEEAMSDFLNEAIPHDALIGCGWSHINAVRGRNRSAFERSAWRHLCWIRSVVHFCPPFPP